MDDVPGTRDDALRVDPAQMAVASMALTGAADHLAAGLKSLDDTVSHMLAGWRGDSGGRYDEAWRFWHEGAARVHHGLSTMAELVGEAGTSFHDHEARAAGGLAGGAW